MVTKSFVMLAQDYLKLIKLKGEGLSEKNTWSIIKFIPQYAQTFLLKAHNQSIIKSKFTMPASQSCLERSNAFKYQMQFQGTLAEIVCMDIIQRYIFQKKLYPEFFVQRYDDIRNDNFKSAEREFDIKIYQSNNPDKYYLIESRSSIAKDRSLTDAIKTLDIIGPYYNFMKMNEKFFDFYIRPLYWYKNYANGNYDAKHFSELFLSGSIDLYIVAGCTKKDMQIKS